MEPCPKPVPVGLRGNEETVSTLITGMDRWSNLGGKYTMLSNEIAKMDRQLRQAKWNDESLARIDTEDLAREAYQLSRPLQDEFTSVDTFIAYWGALRGGRIRHSL